MALKSAKKDECFILVKAQPHRSSRYSETVCCAGIGRDGKWRRQYPVPFRILNDGQKFRRWEWIRYEFVASDKDRRTESQRVDPETLQVGDPLRPNERAKFLNPLVRKSFQDAEDRGESLVLLRPKNLELKCVDKSAEQISTERDKHAQLANQMSMFDKTARALEPCPVIFTARWRDEENKAHRHECDDWETSQAFFKFEKKYGRAKAIEFIKSKFEVEYLRAGLVLAFSTHSRRNVTFGAKNQWLLVGLIRLDDDPQGDFLLS